MGELSSPLSLEVKLIIFLSGRKQSHQLVHKDGRGNVGGLRNKKKVSITTVRE